jgi:hypothetical protein
MENVLDIVRQQAEEALRRLDCHGIVSGEYVAESVLHQAAYWEKPIANGETLVFVRFCSPVVEREEVFLGNILFNAFLSKAFFRAIVNRKLGSIEPVANDLQSYYFLLRTASDIGQLENAFRAEVGRSLPDLFFGEQNEERGIYGSLERMLDFDKANVEPFPVFIMPRVYADRLERAVRVSLLRKIDKTSLARNPTSIMANLAFFYSHDGPEMQSPAKFLGRLAFQHSIVPQEELEKALTIPKLERRQVSRLVRTEKLFDASQKWALRKYLWFVTNILATPARFGWLSLFFSKTDKGDWELDAGKPKDQKAVARLVSKCASTAHQEILDEIIKNVIAYRLSRIDACDRSELKKLFKGVVDSLGEKVDGQPDEWRMPFVGEKFLPHDERTLTEALLERLSLGPITMKLRKTRADIGCRLCGTSPVEAEDKNILMGQSTHRFHNQSSKQRNEEEPKACLRCAICTYLMTKLVGSEVVGKSQVPKTYNLICHYGKHDDGGVITLAQKIDLIWNKVRTHQQQERNVASIRKGIQDLEQKLAEQKIEQKKQEIAVQLQAKHSELMGARSAMTGASDALFRECPWLATLSSTYEIPSFDVLTNIQSNETIERHVLGLGMGGYRMILLVMPQIRAPRDKEHDFAQSRFSHSRITVMAMLAFLRELCGCDGPFYYQSLPALTPDAFQRETFYVRNEPISATRAQKEYEAITQLAWKLIWQRGSDGFVRKVVLAEKLLKDPLGTFAAVMRDSKILGQSKGSYKPLPGRWRTDWKAQDLTEYATFIQRLSKLKEETPGGTQN